MQQNLQWLADGEWEMRQIVKTPLLIRHVKELSVHHICTAAVDVNILSWVIIIWNTYGTVISKS